jgi:hypothetical protein
MNIQTFINNFKKDSEVFENIEYLFTNGYCYHFAVILKDLFHGEIAHDFVDNHFMLKLDGKYFDITGEVFPNERCVELFDEIDDYIYKERLIKQCVYKEETNE